ncbi:hypothetical protein LINPERHAP1_LOCUS23326, partial [Linum perenne]
ALDSVNTTFTNLEQVEANLLQFQSLADPDVISEMPPLERGQSLLMVAKATTILFACMCPLKLSLDRINLYEKKLDRLMDLSKGASSLIAFLELFVTFLANGYMDLILDEWWQFLLLLVHHLFSSS